MRQNNLLFPKRALVFEIVIIKGCEVEVTTCEIEVVNGQQLYVDPEAWEAFQESQDGQITSGL